MASSKPHASAGRPSVRVVLAEEAVHRDNQHARDLIAGPACMILVLAGRAMGE